MQLINSRQTQDVTYIHCAKFLFQIRYLVVGSAGIETEGEIFAMRNIMLTADCYTARL
jgi:hypothetical protein